MQHELHLDIQYLISMLYLDINYVHPWRAFVKVSFLKTHGANIAVSLVSRRIKSMSKIILLMYDRADPLNSKYYCVITQYIAPINTAKMVDNVRELSNNAISKKKYNFRLASPEVICQDDRKYHASTS